MYINRLMSQYELFFFFFFCIPHLTELLIKPTYRKNLYSFLDFQKHITGIIFYCPLVFHLLLLLAEWMLVCIIYVSYILFYFTIPGPISCCWCVEGNNNLCKFSFFHFFFLRLLQTSAPTQKHWSIIHNIMFFIYIFFYLASPSFYSTPVEPFMKCRISKI